jgi:hypothetical protein
MAGVLRIVYCSGRFYQVCCGLSFSSEYELQVLLHQFGSQFFFGALMVRFFGAEIVLVNVKCNVINEL